MTKADHKTDKPPRTARNVPLYKMIPNMITLTAMAFGMTSMKFAIAASMGETEKWKWAVLAIVAAAFMDAFDGAAARILKAQSQLGAELDSFSDFVSFGIAPAFVVYLWSLQSMGKWGWPVALLFAMAVALRLSRFNIATEVKDPNDPLSKYFTGVPSPTGAGLAILPMIMSFLIEAKPVAGSLDAIAQARLADPQLIGLWILVVAGMMVSNFPTFSSKQLRVPVRFKFPLLGAFCMLIAGLINEPWPTLTIMGVVYLFMLPFGTYHYRKKERSLAKGENDPDDQDDD